MNRRYGSQTRRFGLGWLQCSEKRRRLRDSREGINQSRELSGVDGGALRDQEPESGGGEGKHPGFDEDRGDDVGRCPGRRDQRVDEK